VDAAESQRCVLRQSAASGFILCRFELQALRGRGRRRRRASGGGLRGGQHAALGSSSSSSSSFSPLWREVGRQTSAVLAEEGRWERGGEVIGGTGEGRAWTLEQDRDRGKGGWVGSATRCGGIA
jgi:hypothetical protein